MLPFPIDFDGLVLVRASVGWRASVERDGKWADGPVTESAEAALRAVFAPVPVPALPY